MTSNHNDQLRESGNPFYCISGHSNYYSQRDELQKQLAHNEAKLSAANSKIESLEQELQRKSKKKKRA